MVETIIGLHTMEVIHRPGPWRNVDHVELEIFDWVDWFNNRRFLEPIRNTPSVEFDELYYLSQEAPALMAGLT